MPTARRPFLHPHSAVTQCISLSRAWGRNQIQRAPLSCSVPNLFFQNERHTLNTNSHQMNGLDFSTLSLSVSQFGVGICWDTVIIKTSSLASWQTYTAWTHHIEFCLESFSVLWLTNRSLSSLWKNHRRPQKPGASSSCWSPARSHAAVGWYPIPGFVASQPTARPSWSPKCSVVLRSGLLAGHSILSTPRFWR